MKIRGYIPDFKLAFEHFCIHTGGRGVIEEIEKQLQLSPEQVQPSKDALFRYGNTSSSSIWCGPSSILIKLSIICAGADLFRWLRHIVECVFTAAVMWFHLTGSCSFSKQVTVHT